MIRVSHGCSRATIVSSLKHLCLDGLMTDGRYRKYYVLKIDGSSSIEDPLLITGIRLFICYLSLSLKDYRRSCHI